MAENDRIDLGITAGSPKPLPKKSFLPRSHLGIAFLLSFGLCGGCCLISPFLAKHHDSSDQTNLPSPAIRPATLGLASDLGGGDALLGINEESLFAEIYIADELGGKGQIEEYAHARNLMIAKGYLFWVARGTGVEILDDSGRATKVRVLEGPAQGRIGYILPPWIEHK